MLALLHDPAAPHGIRLGETADPTPAPNQALVEQVLTTAHGCNTEPTTVDEVLAAEEWARARAGELVHSMTGRGSTA